MVSLAAMLRFLNSRWILLLILLVFVICKIPQLQYAYYWDESTPYAVAIKAMYNHGASLMPNALNPDLSKGHPLFFHFLAACWMGIFGTSHIAMHTFALTIAVLLLIVIYEAGLRLYNVRVAVLATLLAVVQVIFFVQSAFVLPEVLVALLAFASLLYYVRQRFLLTAVLLTMLFFTKESGLIAGFVIGVDAFIRLFSKQVSWLFRLQRLCAVIVPSLLFGIFLVVQKQQNGWYLYPEHTKLIQVDWHHFWTDFRMNVLNGAIIRDNRFHYFYLLLLLSIVAAVKNRSLKYLVIFFPSVLVYYFVDNLRASRPMPSELFFSLFVVSILWMLYVLKKLKIYEDHRQEQFVLLCIAFIFCYFSYSAINFFTPRYLLAAIFPLLFFAAVILDRFIQRTFSVAVYPVVAGILGIAAYAFFQSTSYGDTDMGAFDGVVVQQDVVDYLEQNKLYDKSIGSNAFLESQHLLVPATGFLHSNRSFTNVHWEMIKDCDYAIADNIEPAFQYDTLKKNASFHLVYRSQHNRQWAEIYKKD